MTDSRAREPLRVGPYELLERVASGGMAEVYVARRLGPHGFHKIVAVKRILPQLVQDEEFVSMFVTRRACAATLSHPNIVQVFDFGEQNGELYMAMEYVDGRTSRASFAPAAARGAVVPLDVCLHIALSVLRGLEYAHAAREEEGALLTLVHRDVSPGNVLIDRVGRREADRLRDRARGRGRAADGRRAAQGEARVHVARAGRRARARRAERSLHARHRARRARHAPPALHGGTRARRPDAHPRRRPDGARPQRGPRAATTCTRSSTARSRRTRTCATPRRRAFAEAIEEVVRRRGISLGAPRLAAWMATLDRESVHPPPEVHDVPTSLIPDATPESPDAEAGAAQWEDERTTPPLGIYRVKSPDGTVSGPLHYHELAELFATGSATAACLVARDAGPFEEPRVFPELHRFVTSSTLAGRARGAGASAPPAAHRAADAAGLAVPPRGRRKTGAVLLRDEARRKKVFLVDGVPEFAPSTDKRELLGEHLIAKAGVMRVEVEMAMSILPRFGGRLGDALVGLGVLRPVELVRAIHEQTVDRYLELFTWRDGEVAFEVGAASGEETFPLGVAPLDLVSRGVRESYTATEIQAWLAALGDAPVGPAESPLLRLDALRWSEGRRGSCPR